MHELRQQATKIHQIYIFSAKKISEGMPDPIFTTGIFSNNLLDAYRSNSKSSDTGLHDIVTSTEKCLAL